jgi:hypothetical protein
MDRSTDFQVIGAPTLFQEIEGSALDASISAESSFRRVLKMLDSAKGVDALTRMLREGTVPVELILSRMTRLASETVDFRYRNPRDIALAAYLYSISLSRPSSFLMAARIVLNAPNTWLCQRLVDTVLEQWKHLNGTSIQPFSGMPGTVIAAEGTVPANAESPWHSAGETVNDFIQIAPLYRGHVISAFENLYRDSASTITDDPLGTILSEGSKSAYVEMMFGRSAKTAQKLPIEMTRKPA